MLHLCRLLHLRLLRDLSACTQKGVPWETAIVCRFVLAERYWKWLQHRVITYKFASPQEEVAFFKTGKPLFTSEIVYANFCYAAYLFQPQEPVALLTFWQRENERLLRFIEDNHSFYTYYKEGRTNMDEPYFLRKHLEPQTIREARVYDADRDALTNKDPLVATLLALERYSLFAEEQLTKTKQATRLM